jgi:hypothetical protein
MFAAAACFHDIGHVHGEEGSGLRACALVDSLTENRHGRRQFFRQVHDAGVLPCARRQAAYYPST